MGVISVDPSVHSLGALLGDRIRLADHFLDPEVFIRSMGTRGHLGGIAEASAPGGARPRRRGQGSPLLETVGTGQGEVEIVTIADTILLVLMPGSGDSIQALKAGIMEIPDVIAVNSETIPPPRRWSTRCARCSPRHRAGVAAADRAHGGDPRRRSGELWEAIEEHRAHLGKQGRLERRRAANLAAEVLAVSTARARARLEDAIEADEELGELLERVQRRELDPLAAVREIMERVFGINGDEDSTDAR